MENLDDDNALLRIINFPTRGIGARTIEQLQESARMHSGGYDTLLAQPADGGSSHPAAPSAPEGSAPPSRGGTLWDAAARMGGKVTAFVGLIEAMRNDTRELPLPEIVDHVLRHSGLMQHYQNETGARQREAQERLENLNELINAATMFVHEAEDDSLTAFLTHAALEAGEHQAEAGADALHLMTVHAAKGLEFHTVFITGLEQGLFPHQNSINTEGGLDEERRLMYVAITRARRRLYLTFAQSRMLHGQVNYGIASNFLRELPDDLLHWITPKLVQRNPFGTLPASTPAHAPATGFGQSVPKPASAGESPWHTGQRVFHQKFGEGVVLDFKGSGADGQVQVNFKHAGTKWLVLEYAKLAAV
jgi:DNA helicase-2/ATP-dependent DNA helicase PcrA